jgi:hypothetical protein
MSLDTAVNAVKASEVAVKASVRVLGKPDERVPPQNIF